ncbi:MAG: hypothetical protein HGB11_09775 [Chlorobiales bacterium]|jgi:hypothetical protein|nr:hypothetical protein [Chlorobiales bacterium]
MRKMSVIVMMMLFCLLPIVSVYAAENAPNKCKEHPLVPKIPGYYIVGCSETPAMADLDIIREKNTESVHFEGKSTAYSYMPQPDLKTIPSEAHLRSNFENDIKKLNGTFFGITYGQEWPVYSIVKDGKKYWIILLVTSGKYYDGSYTCRIIESK